MTNVHPTAIVDSQVELADDAVIGAYSILKGRVTIGPGTIVQEHTHIHGQTIIGRNCRIGPAAYLGLAPQDLKFKGEETSLVIGDDCIIREMASVHRSTHMGLEHATRLGDRCFIMGGVHIGHDCQVADEVIMANAVLLGGHCLIGQRAFLGGGCTLHQFVRIGRLVILSGNEVVTQDVPPFAAVRYGGLKGYNAVGCRRAGLPQKTIAAIRSAFQCIQTHRVMSAALAAMRASDVAETEVVREIIDFIAQTKRGIIPALRARSTVASAMED